MIVSSNGEVVWLSHGIYRSSCDINVEYFPFDLQSCQMKWASWTYDGYQVSVIFQHSSVLFPMEKKNVPLNKTNKSDVGCPQKKGFESIRQQNDKRKHLSLTKKDHNIIYHHLCSI